MDKKNSQKPAARPGPGAGKTDGESAVLALIAAMPGPGRAMGERLHAITVRGNEDRRQPGQRNGG